MNFEQKIPPRRFAVGNAVKFEMKDCGSIALDDNEQITFMTKSGGEYDVARKDWGFYATPSLNGRLEQFGLRGVLIRNTITGRYFVLLVENGHEASFDQYCKQECLEVIAWLDSSKSLDKLTAAIKAST